jgi:hypothetical protein
MTGDVARTGIQDILDFYVHRPGGLDYAAYARMSDGVHTRGTRKKVGQDLVRLFESENIQLTNLLKKLGCVARDDDARTTAKLLVSRWQELLDQVHKAICDLDEDFEEAGQGQNVRVVFDIDMGAFFYTRTSSHAVVFGATLDQAQVNNGRCDEEMRRMVSEIEAICTAHGA